MSTALNLHAGGDEITREQLKAIAVPAATSTWKPTPHFELVQAIARQLAVREIQVTKETFAVANEGLDLFGTLELLVPGTNGGSGTDYAFAMGVRTSNAKRFATQLAVGARVFVCSNLAFSGDLIAMNRKHTAKFDLNADISRAIDRFQTHLVSFGERFEALRSFPLSDRDAKSFICTAFYEGMLPGTLFKAVAQTYLKPPDDMPDVQPRTAYGLLNAMTRAVKQLSPAAQFQATAQLGKLFELTERPSY